MDNKSANDGLWEKVFASMDKNVTEDVLTSNYGDFLLSAVEKAKDQFTAEEYKTLTSDAEKIREIEKKIAALSPESAGDADSAVDGSAFPEFEGTDLDGNPVDSSLFAQNAFTVVNFWFNGCKPCVEELDDLNTLNQQVEPAGKGTGGRGHRYQYRDAGRQPSGHRDRKAAPCGNGGRLPKHLL